MINQQFLSVTVIVMSTIVPMLMNYKSRFKGNWNKSRHWIVEIVEIEDHPFFIGVQYHPEYKSTVANPHPIFVNFVAAAVQAKKKVNSNSQNG
jgi:CTP synthase (UTP-ammonia lyase)